jgi:hypothetical protein
MNSSFFSPGCINCCPIAHQQLATICPDILLHMAGIDDKGMMNPEKLRHKEKAFKVRPEYAETVV